MLSDPSAHSALLGFASQGVYLQILEIETIVSPPSATSQKYQRWRAMPFSALSAFPLAMTELGSKEPEVARPAERS